MDKILSRVEQWWDFVDNRQVIRRIVLFITLWMTWEAFKWATQYAVATKLDGVGTAAVIGAVTLPISALQGYVFKVYSEGRS